MKKLIIVSTLFIVLLLITILNVRTKGLKPDSNNATKSSIVTEPTLKTPKFTYVKVLKSGFSPNIIRIKAGESVAWINESGVEASVNSADHPTHKLNPFLNQGVFSTGSNVQAQFLNKGNFEYHNHFIPSQTGTVIVE